MTTSTMQFADAPEAVAIIGMAGRFPGARNVAEFWENLVAGREMISRFTPAEMEAASAREAALMQERAYVPARGVIEGVESFDAAFFGILPNEAEVMDPQHRVFLECAWHALEDAGYDPETRGRSIGVFAGMSNNSFFAAHVLGHPEAIKRVGDDVTMMANEKDYLATRVSYKLNLRGPSINVATACSTSLVAVCQAAQSLLTFQCDMALAGGVSMKCPQKRGYLYREGFILSPDGHCRAFDARAQGTVFSNGVGVVVLKRLSEALADGDHIEAVIRGSAVNNDGSSKVSFAAPSVDGQAEAIALAHAIAGIDPSTIGYVETHGTGTALGDPIEIAGLTQAFRSGGATATGFCALGALKTNIGHLDAAAGVAGLIKTVLVLKNRLIPSILHFEQPNPQLRLEESPFFVNTTLREWRSDGVSRRAGVSSFGAGGTNAHIVLEEAPEMSPAPATRIPQLLVLSACSAAALETATQNFRDHLERYQHESLADAAYTLQVGRRAFKHRRVIVCGDRTETLKLLAQPDPKRVFSGKAERQLAGVAFLFPGQGAQYVNMGRALYHSETIFRNEVDECSEVLRPLLGEDLRAILYPPEDGVVIAQERITQTSITQPALFVIEYALARLWMSWGVRPAAMIGHSLGEYVAACLAGVFTRDDALCLLARRAHMMQDLPSGAMLAVRAALDDIADDLAPETSVAALNSPKLTVISGDHAAIAELEGRLTARQLAHKKLPTSHAFHSPMMEPMVSGFAEFVHTIPRHAPTRHWVSGLTGRLITDAEAIDPRYWAQQMRQPVRFMDGAGALMDPSLVLLEVGPGQALTSLARQHPERKPEQLVLTSLHPAQESTGDLESMLTSAGRMWAAGINIDWAAFHGKSKRRRISLPTYPFERKWYWLSPGSAADSPGSSEPVASSDTPLTIAAEPFPISSPVNDEAIMPDKIDEGPNRGRLQLLDEKLRTLFSELSGIAVAEVDSSATFLESGFDSLFLTQASMAIQKTFGAKIAFRDLLEDLVSLRAVAERLDQILPAEAFGAPRPVPSQIPAAAAMSISMVTPANVASGSVPSLGTLEQVLVQQLDLMRNQLEIIQRGVSTTAVGRPLVGPAAPQAAESVPAPNKPAPEATRSTAPASAAAAPAAHGPYRPIAKGPAGGMTLVQRKHLDTLIARYVCRTAESKRMTQVHRTHLADPRTVAGFRQIWKEMVYPIVVNRSAGSKLWDVDGNEYVDLVCGFGPILLGHNPDIVRDALQAQLHQGIETGPQTPLAGKVARLVCEMTGMERVAFCNTGSEAVMAAIRVARTVTGRDLIVMFSGAYHGIFDEVLVRAATVGGTVRAVPLAPGIPSNMAENILVLEYGNPAALDVIMARGRELAAVLVEPVQSRRPELQPRDFVKKLRALTEASGSALILDEVVCGFRSHPGGIQALWDVKADLATYGKVVGGGLPIGLVAGCARYMDALDGGMWGYGDDSFPEVGVTFFAGTFVRHPLALAAAQAVLTYLKSEGGDLQRRLNLRTTHLVETLTREATALSAPIRITHFSSWFCFNFPAELPYASLFYAYMRDRGIHMWEGRAGFITTAHTDADLDLVVRAFRETIIEMQAADFLPGGEEQPPVPGARKGRDPSGKKGWFVPDPKRTGKYLQVREEASTHD
jgi:acyl transferase domain-containing protein/glutamate-1-semialdehyde aminotransferase